MTRTTDAELVRQALSGAEQAFSELVRRYKHSVYGVVLSFVRDFDAAEDIAQESFLRAFLHLRALDEPDRFGNWLRIIAANQSRSFLRQGEHARLDWAEGHEIDTYRAADPPDHVLSAERQAEKRDIESRNEQLEAATFEALGELSAANRQALTMHYLGGRPVAEIADFLGITDAAAKMRLYRARKQLRRETLNMVEDTLEQRGLGDHFEQRFKLVELTVMYSELVGLGFHTRNMNAIEEAEFRYEYNNEMTDIILEHSGTLDKYDKGSIVAFFGDPGRDASHAENACSAALAMRSRLNERWADTGLRLRCGLSTGKAVVGDMGSRYRADYTVAGDAVNLAERLVQVERRLGAAIAITQDTCTQVEGRFEVQELDRITFTGSEHPVTLYELLGRHGELDEEKTQLTQLYQRGLDHYRSRKWAEALECFKKAGVKDRGYGFSKRYATRCWLQLEVPEFEAVAALEGEDIQEILRRVDIRDLQEALREMDTEFREVFLNQMSDRVRRYMEEELEAVQLTGYSRDVIAQKYRKIVDIAAELRR